MWLLKKLLMNINSNVYEFKYIGETQAIDAQAVLFSQLHLITLLTEIKNHVAPEAKLNIKLQGLKEGSLEVHQLVELAIPASIFVLEKYSTIKTMFDVMADLFKIKKFLGSKKADKIEETDGKVVIHIAINGDNNTLHVDNLSWNLYTENARINDSLCKTGKILDESEEVNQLDIRKISTKKKLASLNRDDFHKIKSENPYSDGTINYENEKNQIVGIRKPNILPEPGRVLKWDVIYRGNNVSLKISDQDFISEITRGKMFASGDKLLVDIKKTMRLDKNFNMFIETGAYEATVVHKVIPRSEQTRFDM